MLQQAWAKETILNEIFVYGVNYVTIGESLGDTARREAARMRKVKEKRQIFRLPQDQLRKTKDLLALTILLVRLIKQFFE